MGWTTKRMDERFVGFKGGVKFLFHAPIKHHVEPFVNRVYNNKLFTYMRMGL